MAGWEGEGPGAVHPLEREAAEGLTPERRADFLLGRRAARRAVQEAGVPLPTGPVVVGADGRPVFPEGVVGSLTHSSGLAVALAAPASRYVALGVDLEFGALAPGAARHVLDEEERRLLGSGDGRLLAAFSGKEAAFKALVPLTSLTRLRDVVLAPCGSGFLARVRGCPGPVVRVEVLPVEGGVLTWVVEPRGGAPESRAAASRA
ncbi:hypothetical protein ABZ924_02965 [Streptomyces sp. NPDC046876]|uniref:4'-phosphopantetheinyl transferase family protein n=1 Tax=Streptomyces sp. NPDC046876 TaxID=3155616 RepID=UPI0033D99D63